MLFCSDVKPKAGRAYLEGVEPRYQDDDYRP